MTKKGDRSPEQRTALPAGKTAAELADHFEKDPLPHLEIRQDHGPTPIPAVTLGRLPEQGEPIDSEVDHPDRKKLP